MSIRVEHLVKHYRAHHKEPGVVGSIRSFVRRRYEIVKAVDDMSFHIGQGEIVGLTWGTGSPPP